MTFSGNEDDDNLFDKATVKNNHQLIIDEFNEKNIEDLEALYFNDKVNVGKETNNKINNSLIPKLDFDNLELKKRRMNMLLRQNNNLKLNLLEIQNNNDNY